MSACCSFNVRKEEGMAWRCRSREVSVGVDCNERTPRVLDFDEEDRPRLKRAGAARRRVILLRKAILR